MEISHSLNDNLAKCADVSPELIKILEDTWSSDVFIYLFI